MNVSVCLCLGTGNFRFCVLWTPCRELVIKMSLKQGLNVKKAAQAPAKRPVLALDDDEEDDDDIPTTANDDGSEAITSFGLNTAKPKPLPPLSTRTRPSQLPPPRRKPEVSRQDLSSVHASRTHVKEAETLDSNIFDYDSFHDAKSTVSESKKALDRQDAIERKPKYIANLLDAAARRKQDQLIAREKLLQKEREAEGDEFADKEKFVTGAYKEQQAEARRLEEEEKVKAESEEARKRKMGGGMQGFYKTLMDRSERDHAEAVEAAASMERKGGVDVEDSIGVKTDAELAAEMRAKGVNVNDDGVVVDKRELLTAGLNVASSGKAGDKSGADHLKTSASRASQSAFVGRNAGNQQAQRERQTKMMEEQLAAQAKRAREEDDEEKERLAKAAKSTKTVQDVGDAKARYLARKAAKERGEA